MKFRRRRKKIAAEMKFPEGMEVEVKGKEPGFEGSWYAATIISHVIAKYGRYSVEYDSLVSESDESEKLKEVVAVSNLRPRPPLETDVAFQPGDLVDAFHSDGWWEGVIKDAVGDSGFLVHFPSTMDECKFDKSELRQRWDWIDGKWTRKTKEVAGQEQWQGNDATNSEMVSVNPSRSEGRDVDGQQLIDDSSLSSGHSRLESESLTASDPSQASKKLKKGGETQASQVGSKFTKPCIAVEVQTGVSIVDSESLTASETSQPCKKMKEGEGTQGIHLGFKRIKPCMGAEAQTGVGIIVEEWSEANSSGEEHELEKPDRRPKWKKRKASPGKTIHQQTGKRVCQSEQQPETNSSNTESPTRDAEYNGLGTVMENDFIEAKVPLDECNMVAPHLSGFLDEKATSAANKELSQRKADQPLNSKEARNQSNEGHLEHKDIEAGTQLSRGLHSSFPSLIDSRAFGTQSNKPNSKEEDAILQSLGFELEESKGVMRNKETDDTKLSANRGLPFGKGSPVWHLVEKMEAFGLMPQDPHFQPLDQHCEEYREGMALGHMITFSNLVDNTRKSQPEDPPAVFENRLKALAELEGHGFNVKPLQARLRDMLSLKAVLEDCSQNEIKIAEKIVEKKHESDALRQKIIDIDMDIINLEQQLVLLRKKRESPVKEEEIVWDETSRLQKEQKVIIDRCRDARRDFLRLAASPW